MTNEIAFNALVKALKLQDTDERCSQLVRRFKKLYKLDAIELSVLAGTKKSHFVKKVLGTKVMEIWSEEEIKQILCW